MILGSYGHSGGRSAAVFVLLTLMLLCTNAAMAASEANDEPHAEKSVCKVIDTELQAVYDGGCLGGFAQGQGIAWGHDNTLYQGHFVAGKKSGHGVKIYANGDAYAGNWLDDYRHGHGVYEFGEQSPWRGDKYVGQWAQDQRHGRGAYLFYPTGESFMADWEQGQTAVMASPLLIRRKRAYEALQPVLGQVGARICSTLTDGASPRQVAHGQVVAVEGERIQVHIDTQEVLQSSRHLTLNPRWDLMTEWMVCAQ